MNSLTPPSTPWVYHAGSNLDTLGYTHVGIYATCSRLSVFDPTLLLTSHSLQSQTHAHGSVLISATRRACLLAGTRSATASLLETVV